MPEPGLQDSPDTTSVRKKSEDMTWTIPIYTWASLFRGGFGVVIILQGRRGLLRKAFQTGLRGEGRVRTVHLHKLLMLFLKLFEITMPCGIPMTRGHVSVCLPCLSHLLSDRQQCYAARAVLIFQRDLFQQSPNLAEPILEFKVLVFRVRGSGLEVEGLGCRV